MKVLRWIIFFVILMGVLLLVRPDDAITQSFVQRADEYRLSIDYGPAADYLRVALVRQPWNAALYVKLAEALALQHNDIEAQQALAEAERLGADATTVERLRALRAEKDKRFAEAAQHWLQVSRQRPLDETAYRRAVEAATQAEQWTVARRAAVHWVAALNSPEAHFALAKLLALEDSNAALAQWQLSNGDQAQPFVQALQQSDRTLQLMLLGRAYLAQNDLVLAQRAFDEAIRINPGYAEAQAFAGFVRDQRGGDGKLWLNRALEIDPDLIVARYFRARHLWERADLSGALDDLHYAIERDPANALIAAEIGRVYTAAQRVCQCGEMADPGAQSQTARCGDLEIAGGVVRGPIVRHARSSGGDGAADRDPGAGRCRSACVAGTRLSTERRSRRSRARIV